MVFLGMFFLILLQFSNLHSVSANSWQTLSGKPPVVIARGGFSGVFPDSSSKAYELVSVTTSLNVALCCDLQLTKDGIGICFPNLSLYNDSDVNVVYPKNKEWFSVDFTWKDLSDVNLVQNVKSISGVFDGSYQILTVEIVAGLRVYVETFRNEFVTQPFDLFSDSTVEIYLFFVQGLKIDGIITDFPATTARCRKRQCYREMGMFRTGELLPFANPRLLSPDQAPYPSLVESDVKEPPLPEVRNKQRTKAMAKATQVFSPIRTMAVLVVYFISV